MSRPTLPRARFTLAWALALSVILHLVLLIASWLFPFRSGAVEAHPEETTLRFSFAPLAKETVEPKGEIPLPTPVRPTPRPKQPTQPQIAVAPEVASPPPEARAEPEPSRRPPSHAESATDSGVDLPGEGAEHQGRSREEQPRRFDMESALRDFHDAMTQPRPPSPDSRQGVNVPDLPPLPATGFGFGNLEFESRDYDWTDYARQIYMAIWRAWHSRLLDTTDAFERWAYENRNWELRHQNRIRFTIEANGEVTDIVLEGPSGCYPLDDSALDALREVILPPLPADFPRQQETVHARFIAEGNIRTMRRYLTYLRSLGYF